MRVLLCLFTISLVMLVAMAAVATIPADKTPGHPGHCFYKNLGPMAKGEEKPYQGCALATCNNDGSIGIVSCGKQVIHGDCSKVPKYEDVKDKPYPDCCVADCFPA